MKVICECGRDVRYEPPFDDFHVEKVKCGLSCARARKVVTDLSKPEPLFVKPSPQPG